MRPPAYCTWNTRIVFASIRRELSRRISHNINNEHYADYALPVGCEIVSRRIPMRSTSSFVRAVWHPHYQSRSAHREGFAMVSRSFPIPLLHLLVFRFLRIASFYSLYAVVHQTQLLRLGIQLVTAAGS